MSVKFFGKPSKFSGKSLWEIVGNLKNFGEGRLIITCESFKYPEPSFFRIVRIQPFPTPRKEFAERVVILWKQEFYRARAVSDIIKTSADTRIPKFMLVPKLEEEKYLKAVEENANKDLIQEFPKYIKWPPLFKQIWETKNMKSKNKIMEMPNLKLVDPPTESPVIKIVKTEETMPSISTDLYKDDMSVTDMIKEIVRLQKIVNAHSEKPA